MTISSDLSVLTYAADGVTVDFTVPFYFILVPDLRVTQIDALGVRTLLTEGADYVTVGAGNLAGGTVTTSVAHPAGQLIELARIVEFTQLDNFVSNDVFPAETFEQALDKLTMGLQQLEVAIAAVGAGGAGVTIINIAGPGVPLFANQVAGNYFFKKLVGLAGVTLTDTGSEIDIGIAGALQVANNLSDVAAQQTAVNNLTAVAGATNEYVYTKDTGSGNAMWKPAAGGAAPPGGTNAFLRSDGTWTNIIRANSLRVEYVGNPSELVLKNTAGAADTKVWKIQADHNNKTLGIFAFDDIETSAAGGLVLTRLGTTLVSVQLQARTIVSNGVDDGATALQVGGSMSFQGNSRTMVANTIDVTAANRFAFQDSTPNAETDFNIVPNGTSVISQVGVHGAASLTNAAFGRLRILSTDVRIDSGHNGTGTTLPIVFAIDGVEKARLSVAGVFTVGGLGLSTTPTGTGFPHVIAGVQDAAAKLIDTADINASQVTYAKIQNVSATAMLLGRSSAGAGVLQEVAFTTFLQTVGGTMTGDIAFGNKNASGVKTVTFNGEVDDGTKGATATIDFTIAQYHKCLLTASTACTFTFTVPNGPGVMHLKITQPSSGTGAAMTLPAGKWPGSYAAGDKLLSTANNAIDLLVAKWDGAAWWFELAKAWA